MSHPTTGGSSVYVNPSYTSRIEGISREERDALLTHIYRLIDRPRLQMRVRWKPGTVVIYDNLATQHLAVGDHFPPDG